MFEANQACSMLMDHNIITIIIIIITMIIVVVIIVCLSYLLTWKGHSPKPDAARSVSQQVLAYFEACMTTNSLNSTLCQEFRTVILCKHPGNLGHLSTIVRRLVYLLYTKIARLLAVLVPAPFAILVLNVN